MTATELGLDILRGERQRYVSVNQVAYLASLHRRETGETFRSPDYTIVHFNGTGDGWELFRMANGAGILKLISLADVRASGSERRRKELVEQKAGELNAITDRLLAAGINPTGDAEWTRCKQEYRAMCQAS